MNSRRRVNSNVMRLLLINISRVLLVVLFVFSPSSAFGQHPRKFDEIRTLSWPDLMARLDNVALSFQRESPDIVLYLIAYAGPRTCAGQADRLNLRAKQYLVAKRRVASQRIFLMDGGYLDQRQLDVWILPSHVYPPEAVTNIDRKLVRVRNCGKRSSVRR
jgi:hypothetical protein